MEKMERNKILAKLHDIMSEVGFIKKDKTNSFHNYEYASEQAIKEALQPLLVKHKVVFSISVTDQVQTGELTSIKVEYAFFDIESGQYLGGMFAGSGQDKGDKGLYKAVTGAIKYILTSTFLIPTGADPENDSKGKKVAPAKGKPKTLPEVMDTEDIGF